MNKWKAMYDTDQTAPLLQKEHFFLLLLADLLKLIAIYLTTWCIQW